MGQRQGKVVQQEEDDDTSTPILLSNLNSEEEAQKYAMDLHRLAYLGYVDEIREILKNDDFTGESLVRKLDSLNMTPVHNAALGGGSAKIEIVEMMLKHDEDDIRSRNLEPLINLRDIRGRTILHNAAASRQPALISKLLKDFNADPNITDGEGMTPFHVCASQGYTTDAVTGLEILLQSPSINRDGLKSCLHLASAAMANKVVKFLIKSGFDHSTTDNHGMTPLHLAAGAGDTPEAVDCVKELLNVSSIKEVNMASKDGQTALHIAAFKCHPNVLQTLLDDQNVDIWVLDKKKWTALHWATEAWYRIHSLACVKLLVESPKISEWHDKAVFLYGAKEETAEIEAEELTKPTKKESKKRKKETQETETAMDIALRHRSIRIAEYLIQAHSSPDAWLDDRMLDKIYKTLPEAMIPLMNSKGITYNPALFHERNDSIDADFGFITGYKDPVGDEQNEKDFEAKQETKYLHNILFSPKEIQQNFLMHPLVQMFIDLKWKKIRQITWAAIIFQFIWLILYTILTFEIFALDCSASTLTEISEDGGGSPKPEQKRKALKIWLSLTFSSKEDSNIGDCDFNTETTRIIAIIMNIMSVFVVIKEIFQMKNNPSYFKDITNWFQWALLIISFVNSLPAFYAEPIIRQWEIYLAALGIFTGWVLSLREIGKFPDCGIYAAILKQVFLHCLKMLIFYFPLLMAFEFSLRLLLPGKGQYNYLFFGLVKLVIMMTGELDFDETFYEDENKGPKLAMNFVFGQFLFLLLVFLACIVLLNLLTGLAVNDVQSLIEEAEINRLSNELEQIYLLESLIVSLRQKFGKDKLTGLLHRLNVTSVVTFDYNYFSSVVSGIETRSYSQDLRRRIKNVMVPNNSDE